MSAKGASGLAEPLTGRSFIGRYADFNADLRLRRQDPRIPRSGKRLQREAYVAEFGRATPGRNYAHQSNFSRRKGVGHVEPLVSPNPKFARSRGAPFWRTSASKGHQNSIDSGVVWFG